MVTLYDQALTDAKQLKEIAESNAKRAIINALAPKIRNMIEEQLLRESGVDECSDDEDVLNDLGDSGRGARRSEGTDDDTMQVGKSDRVEFDPDFTEEETKSESVEDDSMVVDEAVKSAMADFVESAEMGSSMELELEIHRLCDEAAKYSRASNVIRESKHFIVAINEMFSKIRDMYSRTRESVGLSESSKTGLLKKLESRYEALRKLVKEQKMNRKTANMKLSKLLDLNEETLSIKVNLPDDVELGDDAVQIELPGEEGEDGAPGEEDGDDLGDLDLGEPAGAGDDGMEEEGMAYEGMHDGGDEPEVTADDDDMDFREGIQFDDDDVVEISESMLKREIARLRGGLTESDGAVVKTPGKVPVDDFGGGSDDGDPWLDHDVTTEAKDKDKSKSKKESVESKQDAADKKISKKEGRTNRTSPRLAETDLSAQVADLRQQLTEMNLFNAKLLYTNKLLQNEGLTYKQKVKIVESLDEATTVREVKLVYKSISESMIAGNSGKSLSEGSGARKVLGSSSRSTSTASTKTEPLNEGLDTNRWARLAGII